MDLLKTIAQQEQHIVAQRSQTAENQEEAQQAVQQIKAEAAAVFAQAQAHARTVYEQA